MRKMLPSPDAKIRAAPVPARERLRRWWAFQQLAMKALTAKFPPNPEFSQHNRMFSMEISGIQIEEIISNDLTNDIEV